MNRSGPSSRRITLLLVALVAALIPTTPATATPTGTNGAIAFTIAASDCRDYCTNYRDIYLTDAAGAKPPVRRVGSNLQYDDNASWSPDGNEIVFSAYPYGVSYIDIYKMNADGSNVEALTNDHTNSSPKWSPDGETIAFTRGDAGGWPQLWLMDADGTNERQVPIDYFVNALAWTPGGDITFWGNPSNFSENALYRTDVAGTEVTEIVTLTEIGAATGTGTNFPTSLDWAPDGSRAVFGVSTPASPTKQCDASGNTQQDIWTVTPAGQLEAVTTTDGDLEVYEDEPTWSPNGARIAFSGFKYACVGEGRDQTVQQGNSKLYTMKADGTDRDLIVDPPQGINWGHGTFRPSWQPCTPATLLCGRGPGAGGYPIQDETPPTVDDASRAVPEGSSVTLSKVPVRFTWSATDNETPASKLRFDVQVRDMATTTWINVLQGSPARTVVSLLLPGHTYRLRHRARDQWGNTSAYLTSPEFKPEAVQETVTAPKLSFNGAWTRVAREGAVGGFVRTSTEVNAYATMTFTGERSAGVVLPQREGLGVARVCLLRTGVDPSCADVDLDTTTDPRRVVFARNKLNPGYEYKLRVRVLSGRVDLDMFEVVN